MAQLHVNSTTAGTPTSPYDTWAKAATTLGAAATVAVAGDEVFVHPSHSETAAASITGAGTVTNPVKVICGTPGTTSGITAFQNTAIWGISSSGSAANVNGCWYMRGLSIRQTGSSGSSILSLGGASGNINTYEDCEFYFSGTSACTIQLGSGTTNASVISHVINCRLRYGGTGNVVRLNNRVYATNLSVSSGSATPTILFNIANSTANIPALIEINGFDFSNLANTVRLSSATSLPSHLRFSNVKCPTGWGVLDSTNPVGTELLTGSQLELLNYGDGDTNYRYWIENKQGRALSEATIKVSDASASGNSTATYSKRLTTLANVAYPSSVFRGPPIAKYVEANGLYKDVYLRVAHDGATFTDKEFWIEVSYLGTTGFPLATVLSSAPSYLAGASSLTTSSIPWTGFTDGVTTGPNGSNQWKKLYARVSDVPVRESGWMVVTPCFAVPSKTIFVNDTIDIVEGGAIP